MSFKVCLIHSICVQHSVATIYSSSVVDKEIEVCFLLFQASSDSPKNKVHPLVLFLSSTQPTQYASQSAFMGNVFLQGYHNTRSMVPFKYLKILFIAWTWISFGAAWYLATSPWWHSIIVVSILSSQLPHMPFVLIAKKCG